MVSAADRAHTSAIGIALRSILIAGLVFALLEVLPTRHYYATSLLLLIAAAAVMMDLHRSVSRVVAVTGSEGRPPGVAPTRARIDDQTQALLDTVSAALVVIHRDRSVMLVNRAARGLAGREVGSLADVEAIGSDAAAQLFDLAPGGHRVIRLGNGQRVLASAARFDGPGREAARLLSLQRISAELAAVELAAWDDMARVLAHEMMNSLTPIASLSESLEAQIRVTGVAADVAESLEAIRRRSRGLMEFVNRYRTLSDRPRPTVSVIRLDELMAGLERLLSASFRQHDVILRTLVAPSGLTVRADRQLLEQALLNLLRNALDAVTDGPDGFVEVSCRAARGQVEITVLDNGPGVDSQNSDRVFVPFYTTKAGGSGIGLNLVRYVVLAHGGQLELQSAAPRGARFVLRLPSEPDP